MNNFGLFFSYMIPGIILGGMGVVAIHQELVRLQKEIRRRKAQQRRGSLRPMGDRGKLYVHDMRTAA